MTPDFSLVQRVSLERNILPQTQTWLHEAGRANNELFVLWAGAFQGKADFIVAAAIRPDQKAFKTEHGIGVHVTGDELFRISRWLYEHGQVLVAQVHSHPTDAYHSDTDDNFPMVTAVGQFSVVVPYFARNPLHDLSACAVYRLHPNGMWANVPTGQTQRIFRVVS